MRCPGTRKFWYIKSKTIIVVMSEVSLDVNWKILSAKSLFNMCKSFICVKHGSLFFIVTPVYTCHASFAASSENVCSIYCFVHSSPQSVTQWNCIFPFKIHWKQMFQLFQTRDGPFFFIVTLVTLFLPYHQKIFVPYIVLVTARLSLFCNEILFLL